MKSGSRLLRTPHFFKLIGSLVCIGMLAGCGLRGPLFMPDQNGEQQKETRSSSSTPIPASPVYVPPAPK